MVLSLPFPLSISLTELGLTPSDMLQVIQALVFNFTEGNLVLQSLE